MKNLDYSIKELLDHIQSNKKKVICFGTGIMASDAAKYKEIRSALTCMADNDADKQGKTITILKKEYPVIAPEQLPDIVDDHTVILVASGHFDEIQIQLEKLPLPTELEVAVYPKVKVNYAPCSDEFFNIRILEECLKEYESLLEQYDIKGTKRLKALKEKEAYILGKNHASRPLVLPRIMIMPTTKCNLSCVGCSSLLPMFEHPRDLPVEQIIRDLDIFLKGIDECIRITIGGEPFLYPYLKEVLRYLISQKKFLGIMLITNSTIQPDQATVELLKNPKVSIEISDYGHLEKMSRLITLLEKNHVSFKVLTEQTWTDMGGVKCRNRTAEELRFCYLNCEQSRVIKAIHAGRFHTCARSARMLSLGVYASETDYFELSKEDTASQIREKIKSIYYSDSADACNYCDLGTLPTKVIEAGIQTNKTMTKSQYTIVNRKEYEQLKKKALLKDRS